MNKKRMALFCQQFACLIAVLFFFLHFPASSNAQCDNPPETTELKILTWNIYMLPHFFIHTGQLQRAREIADALKDEEADIIVFEEAFDSKSRNIIWKGLKKKFPYQSGKPQKNVFWKTSGGVWIISKLPLTVVKRIYFKNAKGSDWFACKGAVLVEAEKNNSCFQLVGTHLQSDLEKRDVRGVRQTQYRQIEEELLDPCRKKNMPQFVAGDFNTIQEDSASYHQMLDIMKVTSYPLEGDQCYSFDYSSNDFILDQPYKPQLIDYVLYRTANEIKTVGQACIKVFRKKWNDRHKDLSDHFAIVATINMK